jgi:hypothetical protein
VLSLDRRQFLQFSAAAFVAARSSAQVKNGPAEIVSRDGALEVSGENYSWSYLPTTDTFRLSDAKKRQITAGKLQPAIVVAPSDNPASRKCVPGKLTKSDVSGNQIRFTYEGVNGSGKLSITWRFDTHGVWIEPIVYENVSVEDVVSLHYFTHVQDDDRKPALESSFLVVPGISESSAVSPVLQHDVHLNQTLWLGRGSSRSGLLQQWGLPVHYFAGFSLVGSNDHARNVYADRESDAFVCGLADLPNGDLFLDLRDGASSMWMDYRSDLWKHLRGPGPITLGARLFWAVGSDYYQAIANYYGGLVRAGIVHKKQNSARKNAAALTPQFCTWGAQVSRGKAGDHLDQAFLENIYEELRNSGMKAGMFSIDDKWEGTYGKLEHSVERFPHFEEFLDRVRKDGNRIGIWAALMRCEKPADLGLTDDHMLKGLDGKPYQAGGGKYFILDFTQPEVAKVLADLARKFVRRYKPDLLKFDFGYELPAVSEAAPKDKNWAGERMMQKGLEVVLSAMREENPDLVVMYYQLSPLFLEHFDLHSPDDLFLTAGEYDLEANKRFFFSSLLGRLGVPTYGSTGYDWESAPSIWFDSSVVGTVGSMNDFDGDERGEKVSAALVAKYNGITHALRPATEFEVIPLDNLDDAATRGAHTRSWVRLEGEKPVLLAIRPAMPGGTETIAAHRNASPLRELVQTDVPVVVASQTSDDVTQTTRLAVVPYAPGRVSIARKSGQRASVILHYFKGATSRSQARIEDGRLVLTIPQDANREPLEWVEVQVS